MKNQFNNTPIYFIEKFAVAPTMGKRKAETPAQRTARLERERDQRTSSYLRFLVGVAMHP